MRRRARELTLAQFLTEYPRIVGAEEPTEQEREQQRQQEEARQEDERRQQEQQQTEQREQQSRREDPGKVSIDRAELAALRRNVAEGEKAKRKAEEKRLREQGEYQKIAETKDREATEAQQRLAKFERDQRVAQIARRLKFRDPQDVVGSLTSEQAEDDLLAEERLAQIAKAKPYLIDMPPERPQIGQVLEPGAVPQKGAKAPLTMADVDRMTPEQVADRWDEVAAVIKADREQQQTST